MLDLKKSYDQLPLPKNLASFNFSAKAIVGYKNHRIAKDCDDNPSLLILISEDNQDFFITNQKLFNIKVNHNVKCEIETDSKISYDYFSVVSYIGKKNEIKEIFLKTCEVLIKSLGQNPTNKKIKDTVDKFIELFKSFKEPPKKSIQGLWSELFLIDQSNFPEKFISGWHSIPEEKFDFSFKNLRLEVKSTTSETRVHHFSSSQLNPIKDTRIIIASFLLSINVAGVSITDLLYKINSKLRNHPEEKEKLHLIVYSTIGVDIDRIDQIKYDYNFAKEHMRFYDSNQIPKITPKNIPIEVKNIKFTSLLENSESLNENLDTITKPYL